MIRHQSFEPQMSSGIKVIETLEEKEEKREEPKNILSKK